DGILHVSAADKATGRSQAMQIIPSSGLNDSEIDRMVKDAETHASEDARRKEAVEAQNKADTTIYSAEKFLSDNGDKIPEANKAAIKDRIEAAKAALASQDSAAMSEAADQLLAVMNEAGGAMYQQAGSAGPTGEPTGGANEPSGNAKANDDVIEGEFSDA